MSEALKALLRSQKFLILCLDTVVSLVLYFAAKYASPLLAEDVKIMKPLLCCWDVLTTSGFSRSRSGSDATRG